MSISLTNTLIKLNNHLQDTFDSTTTSAGNAGKTTLVDSALSKYDDGYFGEANNQQEWWVYYASQLRTIKGFTSSSGTIEVHSPFSAQVTTATAYSLHHFDRNRKIVALNHALYESFPHFYKMVTDATSLDGKGSSDNKYTVPNTFTEFPTQIWSIDDTTTDIKRTRITDYEMEEISGTYYFYADITDDEDILLIGKTYLSQFTNDASTTELNDAQAEVVSLLAASIFYRNLSQTVNSEDSGRYDSLANRFLNDYQARVNSGAGMSLILPDKLDWSWCE